MEVNFRAAQQVYRHGGKAHDEGGPAQERVPGGQSFTVGLGECWIEECSEAQNRLQDMSHIIKPVVPSLVAIYTRHFG